MSYGAAAAAVGATGATRVAFALPAAWSDMLTVGLGLLAGAS